MEGVSYYGIKNRRLIKFYTLNKKNPGFPLPILRMFLDRHQHLRENGKLFFSKTEITQKSFLDICN